MHKVVLDGNSDNIDSVLQLGKYFDINSAGTTTIVYDVIKRLSK